MTQHKLRNQKKTRITFLLVLQKIGLYVALEC